VFLTTKFTKETQRAPKARRCRCYSFIAFDGYKFSGFGGIDANWEKDVLPKRVRIVFLTTKFTKETQRATIAKHRRYFRSAGYDG